MAPPVNHPLSAEISAIKTAILGIQGHLQTIEKDVDNLFSQTRQIQTSRLPCENPNDNEKCTPAQKVTTIENQIGSIKSYALGIASVGVLVIEIIINLIKYFMNNFKAAG